MRRTAYPRIQTQRMHAGDSETQTNSSVSSASIGYWAHHPVAQHLPHPRGPHTCQLASPCLPSSTPHTPTAAKPLYVHAAHTGLQLRPRSTGSMPSKGVPFQPMGGSSFHSLDGTHMHATYGVTGALYSSYIGRGRMGQASTAAASNWYNPLRSSSRDSQTSSQHSYSTLRGMPASASSGGGLANHCLNSNSNMVPRYSLNAEEACRHYVVVNQQPTGTLATVGPQPTGNMPEPTAYQNSGNQNALNSRKSFTGYPVHHHYPRSNGPSNSPPNQSHYSLQSSLGAGELARRRSNSSGARFTLSVLLCVLLFFLPMKKLL